MATVLDDQAVEAAIHLYCKRTKAKREDVASSIGIRSVTLWKKVNGESEWKVNELTKLSEITDTPFGRFFMETADEEALPVS